MQEQKPGFLKLKLFTSFQWYLCKINFLIIPNFKNVSPLAVIPLSVTHSEILKNILIKYRIYPEILIVIEGWGGG